MHYCQIKRKLFPRYRKGVRDGHNPIPAKRGRKPAAATAQQAGGQVQSLTRGLKLLEWIAESHSSVALTELAQQAGLPNSTTHRLLTTMQQLGFVRRLASWVTGP